MSAFKADRSDEMRQIRIGFLIWALIWMVNKAIATTTLLALPSSSFAAVDLSRFCGMRNTPQLAAQVLGGCAP